MRTIGKVATLIIVMTILVLLMVETTWACRLKNCKWENGAVRCKLECTEYQAKSAGIGRIAIFGRPDVNINFKNLPKPGNWIPVRFQTGIRSYALNLIPNPPITEGGTWDIFFNTDDREIEAFVVEIREADSDRLKERFHLER
jgi:hypothetical protein